MFLVTPDENIYWGVGRAYGIANGYEGVYMLRVCIQGVGGGLLDKRSL